MGKKNIRKYLSHKNTCPARISTSDILTRTKDYNQSGDATALQASEFVNIMKDREVKSMDCPHQIQTNASEFIPQLAPQLPTVTSMRKTMRYTIEINKMNYHRVLQLLLLN